MKTKTKGDYLNKFSFEAKDQTSYFLSYKDHESKRQRLPIIDTGSQFLSGDPDLLIREYFLASPSKRRLMARKTAKQIKSVKAILAVMNLSLKKDIKEGFDGAVALLAECDEATIRALKSPQLDYSNRRHNLLDTEQKMEILITAIACASNISPRKRFNAVVKLITPTQRRAIKAAIIDALIILSDEFSIDAIKEYLNNYSSNCESDQYIREYANEALQDIL
jgi:hypothetical protein